MSGTFTLALKAAGLRPRDVVPDGKIRRCTTDGKPNRRNGWYVLHPDGSGAWGDWTSGSGEALGHWKDEAGTSMAQSPAVLERMRRQREAERAQRLAAMRHARDFWQRARQTTRLHPYLNAKGLSPVGTQGLREHDGHLVVPVWHGDWLISVQTIHPDGTKRFFAGAPVKGGAFVIERPRAALTCICEGLATGLAVFQAVKTCRVVVAFDAGNLQPVVNRLRPSGNVVLCADNDHGTLARRGFNPGIEKATNAAELIGAGVAYPEGIEGTDWADALKQWGVGGARRVERLVLGASRYVIG